MKNKGTRVLAVVDQVVPLPHCLLEDCRIRRLARTNEGVALDTDGEAYLELKIDLLKESFRAALAFRDQLQRRAQGYLLAVTVATTFSFGVVSLLSKASPAAAQLHGTLNFLIRILLLGTIVSFFMSASLALRVMSPSPLFDVWLRSQLPDDEDQRKTNIIHFTKLNEAYAMAYECLLRGSYVSMRNGVILLFVVLALAVAHTGIVM